MMLKLFILFIFSIFIGCNQLDKPIEIKLKLKDPTLKIFSMGLLDIESHIQRNQLAKEYGFQFEPLGCIISKVRRDSIDKINIVTKNSLNQKLGENWFEEFMIKYDTLKNIKILASEKFKTTFESIDNDFYYLVNPSSDKNIYRIKLYKEDNKTSILTFYYEFDFFVNEKKCLNLVKVLEKV